MSATAEDCRKLLGDIEDTLRGASVPTRTRIFERTGDLFLHHAEALDSEAVGLFDQVFLRQIDGVDEATLAATSARLAPIDKAPPYLVRMLARHGVAAVATPVLAQSPVLKTQELIGIAKVSSQAHRAAIAQRPEVDEMLTQVLVEHGDQDVMNRLAANPGARYFVADFGTMLGRATADERARVMTRMPVAALNADGSLAGDCTMLDVSPGGAKLECDAPANVPEVFTLELTTVERKQIQCRAVWRRASIIGLRFATPLIALWDPTYEEDELAESIPA
jgi:hypothetical protein